jgi:hypothetical protein
MQQSQEQFAATMSGITRSVHEITGGDTFCYLDIFGEQIPLLMANLRKHGSNPLYDLRMTLLVSIPNLGGGSSNQMHTQRIAIGNVMAADKPTFADISLQSFNLQGKGRVDFNIAFAAKNGFWHQLMYLRRLGDLGPGGRWLKATKVFRIDYGSQPYKQAKSVLVFERIDDEFPMEGIGWVDWLLYDN